MTRTICRALIGVLLFAQLAVAGYACPGLTGMVVQASADSASAGQADVATVSDRATSQAMVMPPSCHQKDGQSANLCAEHCRLGQQSADTPSVPVPDTPLLAMLYPLSMEPEALPGSARALPAADPVLTVPAPPHAILHCVYRT